MVIDVDIDSRKYVPVNSNGFTGKKPFAQVETVSSHEKVGFKVENTYRDEQSRLIVAVATRRDRKAFKVYSTTLRQELRGFVKIMVRLRIGQMRLFRRPWLTFGEKLTCSIRQKPAPALGYSHCAKLSY